MASQSVHGLQPGGGCSGAPCILHLRIKGYTIKFELNPALLGCCAGWSAAVPPEDWGRVAQWKVSCAEH